MIPKVIEADEAEAQVRYGLYSNEVELSEKHTTKEIKESSNKRLDLLYEVGKKVSSVSRLTQLLKQMTQMTQHTLKASASSVLLFDEGKQTLSFKVAEGEVGKVLKQVRLDSQSGIAGWVACHGKPLIVNDVRKDPRFYKGIDEVTGFITRAIMCVPLVVNRRTIGVLEVLNKQDGSDFNDQDLVTMVSVASTAAMAIENTRLHQSVVDGYKSTIEALAAAIDAKDPYTCGHSERVALIARWLAERLALSPVQVNNIYLAGLLHDVGKIGVSETVLCKPGKLTADEFEQINRHPQIGANILGGIKQMEQVTPAVLSHHEHFDGSGYPRNLRGENIPLAGRVIMLADSFDAMTSDRTYRKALPRDTALAEIRRFSGTQFDPALAEMFLSGNVKKLADHLQNVKSTQESSDRLYRRIMN